MPADFGIIDPQAFFKGAANTNALMQRVAQQKAGKLLASGDTKGAMATLNESGDLQGARDIQLQLDEKDDRLAKMTAQQRARQTQMIIDVTAALEDVRKKHGDQAVFPAFQQLVPMLKANGASDEDLAPYAEGFRTDPARTLAMTHQIASQHMKQYVLGEGAQLRSGSGDIIASNPKPARSRYHVLTPGSSMVEEPPEEPQLPEEVVQQLQANPGHHVRFRNGQTWMWGDNGPERVE